MPKIKLSKEELTIDAIRGTMNSILQDVPYKDEQVYALMKQCYILGSLMTEKKYMQERREMNHLKFKMEEMQETIQVKQAEIRRLRKRK